MEKPDWQLNDFNDKGALRIRTGLVFTLIFLSRDFILLIMGAVSQVIGRDSGQSAFKLIGLPPVWMLPLSAIALIILLLLFNRERFGRRDWWRLLIRRLRPVLLALSLIQLLGLVLLQYKHFPQLKPVILIQLGLLPLCLVYLARDLKLRHFICEFSKATDSACVNETKP